MAGRGAPLVDVHCTGTAIRDFINVADERGFDEQTVIDLFGPPPSDAMLVFGGPDGDSAGGEGADGEGSPAGGRSAYSD